MFDFNSRYDRAFNQRLYLVSANLSDNNIEFNVMGSTGNIYNINIITNKETCTCPDYVGRQTYCKHIFFILGRVLNISKSDICNRMYDIRSINNYINDHNILQQFIQDDLACKLNRLQLEPKKEVEQKTIEDNCPICFEEMNKSDNIVYCKYVCGKSLHKECFEKWNTVKSNQCVYCRGKWDISKQSTKYINLINT